MIRWGNDQTAIVLVLPGRDAVARLSRTPDGHTTGVFWPMLTERQPAWPYGRLLHDLDALPDRCPSTLR